MGDAPKRVWLIDPAGAEEYGIPIWDPNKSDLGFAHTSYNYVRADIARADLEAAVLAEREACAGMADKEHQALMTAMRKNPETHVSDWSMIADAIRARKP